MEKNKKSEDEVKEKRKGNRRKSGNESRQEYAEMHR
jgi:hypothetical protein